MSWPSNSEELPPELADSDAAAGFEITSDFQRFNQMDDMFTRAFWDDTVRSVDTDGFFASYRMDANPRKGEGFSQRDFALRNAAWMISDVISNRGGEKGIREGFQGAIENDTPIAPVRTPLGTPDEEANSIKNVAKLFGADLVGITAIDPRWHYSHRPDLRTMTAVLNDLPEGLAHVIVMGHAMDIDLVDTYPSALAGASTGREYSHETAIVMQVAAYIRNLGYQAVASMNDTALVIPYAIKAGLGEYGRNQMVLTPEFGPRVRFSKIFTDMPMANDAPKSLGLTRYCVDCTVCADACPPKALPTGAPVVGSDSPSTVKGVKKWSANCEACFGYWAKIKTDCAICMRVCPFNRRYDKLVDRIWFALATSRWRAVARWYDARKGRRPRLRPRDWWAAMTGAKIK